MVLAFYKSTEHYIQFVNIISACKWRYFARVLYTSRRLSVLNRLMDVGILKISSYGMWCFSLIIGWLQWRHDKRDGVSNHQPHDFFTQPFIQAQIKENMKAPRHWTLWGEFTDHRWIPRTTGQSRGKCFHLMTSSFYQVLVDTAREHIVHSMNCVYISHFVVICWIHG